MSLRPPQDIPSCHSSDLSLAQRAAAGSASAWMDLVRAHQGLVQALLVRHVRSLDREDLFQDVFLRIHRGLRRYAGLASLSTWIFQITMNVIRSHWETRQRQAQREVLASDHAHGEDGSAHAWDIPVSPDQEDALEDRMREERIVRLRTEIRRMGPLDRQVLLLRELDNSSYEEIAERLAIPVGTVKSRLSRARRHLIDRLAEVNR